ncbi:MAG TPA: phosphatidylglycerophosphatase A [Candidatus Acidoferrales bacterium]|nr:phosphatidylglycerophosphatase A [Candidatus Acidoferrales bacterium]
MDNDTDRTAARGDGHNLREVSQGPGGRPTLLDKLITTGFGAGLSPFAPGTVGSFVGLLVYFIPGFERVYVIVPAFVVFFVWGTFAAGRMEKEYGHDPPRVVIDEIVAFWVAMAFIPKRLFLMAAAFLIFRMLDIFKPFPANYFDKKSGGIWIMLDDLVCGVYTNIILQIYLYSLK